MFGDAANPEESFDVSLDNAVDEAVKFATDHSHQTLNARKAVETLYQEMYVWFSSRARSTLSRAIRCCFSQLLGFGLSL